MAGDGSGQKSLKENAFGVLLVRSRSRSAETAQKLAAKGIPCHCLPLSEPRLIVDALPGEFRTSGQRADIVFTSPTAVEMFEKLLQRQPIRLDKATVSIWCVGDKTAEAARFAGFSTTHSASGNVANLCDLMAQNRDTLSGTIFYMAPRDKAGDLSAMLGKQEIHVRTIEIYANELVDCGKEALIEALTRFQKTCLFNYSRRSTLHFFALLQKYELKNYIQNMDFISLSDNVAGVIGQDLRERNEVAKLPQERFMIEMAGQHMQSCCDF